MTQHTRAVNPAPRNPDDALGVSPRPVSKPGGIERDAQSLAFAIEAARLLRDDKCENVLLLDLRGRSQVTDYFVIASGTSDRQMRSAGEHTAELAKGVGISLFGSNLSERGANWILLDFVDVVIHVFDPEKRLYYDIEMLWGDAPRVPWERAADAPPPGRAGQPIANRNHAGLTGDDVLPGRR